MRVDEVIGLKKWPHEGGDLERLGVVCSKQRLDSVFIFCFYFLYLCFLLYVCIFCSLVLLLPLCSLRVGAAGILQQDR